MSMLDDVSVQMKNIAKNIDGGKFKADKKGGLIRTKSDLEAFKKLFGEYKNWKQQTFEKNLFSSLSSSFARRRRRQIRDERKKAEKLFTNL